MEARISMQDKRNKKLKLYSAIFGNLLVIILLGKALYDSHKGSIWVSLGITLLYILVIIVFFGWIDLLKSGKAQNQKSI